MRFSQVVVVYFLMGTVMWGAGVVTFDDTGLVGTFVEVENGEVGANNSSIVAPGEDDTGILENLVGPVKEALETVAGGSILAAFGAIDRFLGFYAWPVKTAVDNQFPREAVAISGVLVVSFTFGVLKIFAASI